MSTQRPTAPPPEAVLAAAALPATGVPPAAKTPQPAAGRKPVRRRLVFAGVLAAAVAAGSIGLYGLVADTPVEAAISGRASLATPLRDATVKVYEMGRDGQPGALLGTTATDDDGYYDVSVRRRSSSSLLVITSGGSYIDPIDVDSVSAGSDHSLKTVLRPGSSHAALTPLTTFAAVRASSLAAEGKPLDASVEASFAAVARQFNLETITDVDSVIAIDAQEVQLAGRTARQMGLILAGLDREAHDLGVTTLALTAAIAEDQIDGILDGRRDRAPLVINKTVPLPADATTSRLQDAIKAVAASPANVTHLSAPQIALEAPQIDLNTAGLIYVSSSVLPAWIDGQPGTAGIRATGGTGPYSCELTSGDLPNGFSLSGSCAISGGGTSVLGTSPMRISTPFTVRISDSSEPPQSVSVDLRVTIIAKPPTIAVSGGKCPRVGKACSITVATAKGGTPPYYFTTGGFGTGTPPLGMIVNLKGVLTGTPKRAGSYAFRVCVVDLVGATNCASTNVQVGDASPSPTSRAQNNLPAGFPTNLPSGSYNLSVCTSIPAANYNSCVDGGNVKISAGDAGALAEALSQVSAEIRSACACTVQYTVFNGAGFDMVITDKVAGSVVRIRVTKVG